MPINLSTSNVLARSFLFSRGSTGKLTETQWLNDSETDHEYIPGGCISASSLSTAPHGLGCGTSTHIIRFPWPFIDVHLWTQKRMSNALWQDPRWISFRDKIGHPAMACCHSLYSEPNHAWTARDTIAGTEIGCVSDCGHVMCADAASCTNAWWGSVFVYEPSKGTGRQMALAVCHVS